MTVQLVHVSVRNVQPVLLNIPLELWEKLQAMTPPEFSVQDTVIVAVQAFVDEEGLK